ncbi:hypothetical protein [Catellatospora sp. NPDC049133]|uniref:hypothetical protein n=1 Tax=Catellatospora sp. NPDC049133 TaxID=3155499 RepID=UPI0033E07F22
MPKIRSLVAMLAVGVAAALSAPVTAQAADQPVVNWAHSDYGNDYGTLLVSATAADGVSAITAHILTSDTRQEVATVEAFTLRSGTTTDGVWAGTPIVLDDLGVYTVDVEITDTDGTHVRQDGIGELYYAMFTYFENVSLNRTSTTYDKRTVTMRGTLLGRRPGSGVVEPVAGARVYVLGTFNFVEVTTKPDGTFAGTVEIVYESEDVWADYGLTQPMHTRAQSEPLRVTVSPRPVRVSVNLDKAKLNRGESLTATGQITWKVAGVWTPLAGVEAFVSFCATADQDSCNYIGSVTTDADGRFSYTTTPLGGGHIGVTHVQYTADGGVDPYVKPGFGSSRLFTVLQPSAFTSFYGGRYDQGRIGVYGNFTFTGGRSPAHFEIKLQYSANGVDGWRTHTTFTDQYSFEVTGVDMPGAVYWRAVYPGDTGFQKTVSEVVAIPAL